jgi:Ser-tRNA(Ala) deacylase AlaX
MFSDQCLRIIFSKILKKTEETREKLKSNGDEEYTDVLTEVLMKIDIFWDVTPCFGRNMS